MSKIISISTAVPEYKHAQENILKFMQNIFAMDEKEKRKLKFLYHQGGIDTRYSVIPDYGINANEWLFYPASENLEPFPDLELRMQWFNKTAAPLSIKAIEGCIENKIEKQLKRIHKGVCPCCNRSFTNLKRHMETKHPEHPSPPKKR